MLWPFRHRVIAFGRKRSLTHTDPFPAREGALHVADGDPMHPCIKCGWISKSVERCENIDGDVLSDIPGVLAVLHHRRGCPERGATRTAREKLSGSRIPSPIPAYLLAQIVGQFPLSGSRFMNLVWARAEKLALLVRGTIAARGGRPCLVLSADGARATLGSTDIAVDQRI